MSIQIERAHTLQQLNWRSSERVVEVSFQGVPSNPLSSDERQSLWEELKSLSRPPSDEVWFQQLTALLRNDESHISIIAALAVYLQRHIVRHNGRVWFDEQPENGAIVALECLEFEIGLECLKSATNLVNAVGLSQPIQIAHEISQLQANHHEYSLGAVTGPIVAAAKRLGVPFYRLDHDGLVQLGQGRFQRRIRRSCTDRTSYVADAISADKPLVKRLWRQMGIPVPHGREVVDAEDAVRAAREIGWPVVIKPCDGDCGQGVRVNLGCESRVEQAFHIASAGETRVMIERHLPGNSFRFLVIDQKVVSVVCRLRAHVKGDGEHSVRELLNISNRQANRGPDRRWHLLQLPVDEVDTELLREQGLGLESVPVQDRSVWLRQDLDYSSTLEVLDQVHPSTLSLALDAASVIGLDVAGIDVVATDISRALDQQNGGFLEINSYPGIALHLAPICDKPRPVGESIVSMLFPDERSVRVPSVLVIGDIVDHQTLRSLFTSVYGELGPIAVSTPALTELGGHELIPPSRSLAHRIGVAMNHSRTAGAVLVASMKELLDDGVGLDFFDVIMLMNGGQVAVPHGPRTVEKVKLMTNRLLDHCRQMIVNLQDPIWKDGLGAGNQYSMQFEDSPQRSGASAHSMQVGHMQTIPSRASVFSLSPDLRFLFDECQQRLWSRLTGTAVSYQWISANSSSQSL